MTTHLPVRIHPQAEQEARAARRWYRARNRDAAERFMVELDRAMLAVGDHPDRWPAYLKGTRRLHLRRFPYSVVYRIDDHSVLVVAVAHDRRHPGYWAARR